VGVKREYARREESKAKQLERERMREGNERETKETTNRGG
jgi:hypothetical protein